MKRCYQYRPVSPPPPIRRLFFFWKSNELTSDADNFTAFWNWTLTLSCQVWDFRTIIYYLKSALRVPTDFEYSQLWSACVWHGSISRGQDLPEWFFFFLRFLRLHRTMVPGFTAQLSESSRDSNSRLHMTVVRGFKRQLSESSRDDNSRGFRGKWFEGSRNCWMKAHEMITRGFIGKCFEDSRDCGCYPAARSITAFPVSCPQLRATQGSSPKQSEGPWAGGQRPLGLLEVL